LLVRVRIAFLIDIFKRRGSHNKRVRRPNLKLASDRSVNAQRNIRWLASLSGGNLFPGEFIGGIVQLNFLRSLPFVNCRVFTSGEKRRTFRFGTGSLVRSTEDNQSGAFFSFRSAPVTKKIASTTLSKSQAVTIVPMVVINRLVSFDEHSMEAISYLWMNVICDRSKRSRVSRWIS
jgi:hypothetical protein